MRKQLLKAPSASKKAMAAKMTEISMKERFSRKNVNRGRGMSKREFYAKRHARKKAGKGRGWHGDSAGHRAAALSRGKKRR